VTSWSKGSATSDSRSHQHPTAKPAQPWHWTATSSSSSSTSLGETADRIHGLNSGATDYVVKPFAVAELAARIRAQLRSIDAASSTRLRGGAIEADLLSRKVWVAGRQVRLSATEFQLLAYFLQNPGHVLTRQQILRAVWGYEHDPGTNSVEVYIGYLRRKLRDDQHELPLVTIKTVGYRFDGIG
jgi:DNA-binding response OmpR family regulator